MKNLTSSIEPLEARIAPATLIVTSLADNGPGTLRTALLTANMTPATVDTIVFKLPTAPAHGENTITLTSGVLFSVGNVNIIGPGAGKLIISGGGNSEVFDFSDNAIVIRGPSVDSPVSISGLSIVDGHIADGKGAGIYSSESLTLKNVVISGNTITGTSAGDSGGGLYVNGADTLTKVSISNCLFTGNSTPDEGGGMFLNTTKSASIVNSIISDNNATVGAGAYLSSVAVPSVVTITGCTIAGNTSSLIGGGLAIQEGGVTTISATKITGNNGGFAAGGLAIGGREGKTLVTGSLISANSVEYIGAGIEDTVSGAIATGTTPVSLTIAKSTISGNRTTTVKATFLGGGGIYVQGSATAGQYTPVTITGAVISSNFSANQGGGIAMTKGVVATLSTCTVSGNSATAGGGIATAGTGDNRVNLTVKGGVFSANTVLPASGATGNPPFAEGGAILAKGDGTLSLTSTLITGNAASSGGGIYVANTLVSATPTVTLKNVIETNNVGGAFTSNSITSPFSITGGLMKGNAAFNGAAVFDAGNAGSIIGTIITGNVAAGKGGGIYAVSTVDAADFTVQIAKVTGNTAPVDPDVRPHDLRLSPRHPNPPPRSLAIAYTMKNLTSSIEPLESRIAPAAIVVTSLGDNGPGTLRAALLTASATPATVDTITFKLPTAPAHSENIINLTTGPLDSTGNVNIVGPGSGKLIINGGGTFRVFDITDDAVMGRGVNTDSPVSISGLSIVGGSVGAPGAGIFSTESLTLKSVVVSGNTVTGAGGSAYGGGVDVLGNAALTKVSISNSLITGNSARTGGGMHLSGTKSVSLVKSVISDNTSTLIGAGAYLISSSVPAVLTITGCTIAGNTVASGGLGSGLVIEEGGSTTISATKITGNAGGNLGGGLMISGHEGKTTITGSVISANAAEYGGAGIADNATGPIPGGTSTPVSLTISKSTISGNQSDVDKTADLGGGGIYIQGNATAGQYLPVTITSTVISSNASGHEGGGIAMTKGVVATLSTCTISGNSAATGGGGLATAGTGTSRASVTIKGGSFSGNVGNSANPISGSGGGILANGDGTLSLTSTLLTGNVAAGGGGIYAANTLVSSAPTVTLNKVTETNNVGGAFTSNSITSPFSITGGSMKGNAAFNGAAVFNAGDAGSIIGTIISGNVAAGKGGGIYAVSTVDAADFTVQIAKVTGNTAPIDPNVFGPMTYV